MSVVKDVKFSRRQMMLSSLFGAAAVGFSTLVTKTQDAFAQAKAFVTEADPVAKALKYVEDPSKVKPDPRKDKAGAGGKMILAKNQTCANCAQYNPLPAIGGKPAGKCNMIQSGAVHPGGWCSVWVHKPGT